MNNEVFGAEVGTVNVAGYLTDDDVVQYDGVRDEQAAANSINRALEKDNAVVFNSETENPVDPAGYRIAPPVCDPSKAQTGISPYLKSNATPAGVHDTVAKSYPVRSTNPIMASTHGKFVGLSFNNVGNTNYAHYTKGNVSFSKWMRIFQNSGMVYISCAENIVFVNSKMYDADYVPISTDYMSSGVPLYDDLVENMCRGDIRRANLGMRRVAKLAYALKQSVLAQTNDTNPFYGMTLGEIYDRLVDYFVTISRDIVAVLNVEKVIANRLNFQGLAYAYYSQRYSKIYTADFVYRLTEQLGKLKAQLLGEFMEPVTLSHYVKCGSIGLSPVQSGRLGLIIPSISGDGRFGSLKPTDAAVHCSACLGDALLPSWKKGKAPAGYAKANAADIQEAILNDLRDRVSHLLGATISLTRVALNAFNALPRVSFSTSGKFPVAKYLPEYLLAHQDLGGRGMNLANLKMGDAYVSSMQVEGMPYVAMRAMRKVGGLWHVETNNDGGVVYFCINNRGGSYVNAIVGGDYSGETLCDADDTSSDPYLRHVYTNIAAYSRKTALMDVSSLEGAGFESDVNAGLAQECGIRSVGYDSLIDDTIMEGSVPLHQDYHINASCMHISSTWPLHIKGVTNPYAVLVRGILHNPGSVIVMNGRSEATLTELGSEIANIMAQDLSSDICDAVKQAISVDRKSFIAPTIAVNGLVNLDEQIVPYGDAQILVSHHLDGLDVDGKHSSDNAEMFTYSISDLVFNFGLSGAALMYRYTGIAPSCVELGGGGTSVIITPNSAEGEIEISGGDSGITMAGVYSAMAGFDSELAPEVYYNEGMAHRQLSLAEANIGS